MFLRYRYHTPNMCCVWQSSAFRCDYISHGFYTIVDGNERKEHHVEIHFICLRLALAVLKKNKEA